MDIRNRRALKEAARARLSQATYDPRKLALLHTAVGVGVALAITLIDYFLNNQIEAAGGLSGMGLRSVLGTAQMTLQYIHSLAMPFWQIGFVYAALRMYRGEQVAPGSLTEGFRRFGSVLRLRLMEGVLFFGAAMICMYAASFIFAVTPFAAPVLEMLMPLVEPDMTVEQLEAAIMQIPADALMPAITPFLVIFGILFLILGGFLFYRLRVVDFLVMDEPKTGGLSAMIGSRRMTRRNRLALLRLDLSFWWFYVLLGLTVVIGYLDLLLPLLGVSLPMSSEAAWFVFYILGMLAQMALYWYGYSYVQTTYAAAYEVLREQMQTQVEQTPMPQKLPWDNYETN